MELSSLPPKLLHLLPLILLSQVPLTNAVPFQPRRHDGSNAYKHEARGILNSVANLVYQIADGQVQAPGPGQIVPSLLTLSQAAGANAQVTLTSAAATDCTTSTAQVATTSSTVGAKSGLNPTGNKAPSATSRSNSQTVGQEQTTTLHSTRTSTIESTVTITAEATVPAVNDGLDSPGSTAPDDSQSSPPKTSVETSSTVEPPGPAQTSQAAPASSQLSSSSADVPTSATRPSSQAASTNNPPTAPASTAQSAQSAITSVSKLEDASLTKLSTSDVQTASASLAPAISASSSSSLGSGIVATSNPVQPASIVNATTSLSLVQTATLPGVHPTADSSATAITAQNIFQPIATDAPPSQIPSRSDHPVPLLGVQQQQNRLQTNKFYGNFYLGSQTQPSWTHPFSVSWGNGDRESGSWGLAITHVERSEDIQPGPKDPAKDAGEWGGFGFPTAVESLVISATELSNGTSLTTDSQEAFSVNVNLRTQGGNEPVITFPLLQGMSFVTGVYRSGTPLIQSGIGITDLVYSGAVIDGTTYKYRATLQNGHIWLIYITPKNPGYDHNSFTLRSAAYIQGPSGFGGYIQITKIPRGSQDAESVYDSSAGVYATSADMSGSVDGTTGSYTLSWSKQGQTSRPLLMFALPHHLETLSNATAGGLTNVSLTTTTKGLAQAVRGDSWTLVEPSIPVSMGFGPWSPQVGNMRALSNSAMAAVQDSGLAELSQNITLQTNVGSLYFDGKALAKYAGLIYTLYELGGNRTLALTGLQKLQVEFQKHVDNQMQIPVAYDTRWGGIVSTGGYGSDLQNDFGNTVYNDHHFHYGYFVYSAAVIGYLDPSWLTQGSNKAWVNALVRDYANSIPNDPYFPFARHFDWYHGHSWAKGVSESADGKDQESSSEDTMATYAVKMWGRTIHDTNMEARGNLMLAVQRRALHKYYLYDTANDVQPPQFIGNKAAGILFENKIDHTTYFGAAPAYVQGIHMLPVMPFTRYTRPADFVRQEWDAYFADGGLAPAGRVESGWRGILEANHALVNATDAYDFFSRPGFDRSRLLDGGASQTWYLAWAAGLGGNSD